MRASQQLLDVLLRKVSILLQPTASRSSVGGSGSGSGHLPLVCSLVVNTFVPLSERTERYTSDVASSDRTPCLSCRRI